MSNRRRLDELLVANGFYASRSRARDAILRGTVRVDGVTAAKPALLVLFDAVINLADEAQHYVSRAALKLKHGLRHFNISAKGCRALDIGASTGGFTQVLLEEGAAHVTAIDVGHGQMMLHDPRVKLIEGLNARDLTRQHLGHAINLIVCDVSFISLKLALPQALSLAEPGATLIALVKPQFEAGRDAIGKGGLVTDEAVRQRVCKDIAGFLESERGRFLICDYRASAKSSIWSFKLNPDGAGFKFSDAYPFITGSCATDLEYSYDGRLFVADFLGGWISWERGRIYSLTAESERNAGRTPDTAALMKAGFETKSDADLIKLFGHPDQRIRQRAHLTLAGRNSSTPLLIGAAKQGELIARLHGIWGLGIRARKNADQAAATTLVALLTDPQAEVRAQAAHLLGEVAGGNPANLIPLLQDDSLRVRSFAALSLGRLKAPTAFDPMIALLVENADRDLYLRHAGIMGLLGSASPEQIAALKSHASASVRLAAVVALRRLASPALADFLTDADPRVSDEAIRAISEAPVPTARPALNAMLDAYTGATAPRPLPPMIARRLIHCAFRTGGKENAARLVSLAAGKALDPDQRLEALRLLLQWAKPTPVDQCLGKWDPLPERDLAEIVPTLEAGLPALLAADEVLLGPTLLLVEQLKLSHKNFSQESLLRIVKSTTVSGPARATALDLWVAGKPKDADSILLELAADPSDELAGAALANLAKNDPAKALEGASVALKSSSVSRRQGAWKAIAGIPGRESAVMITQGLQRLISPKPDGSTQIELLAAAASRTEPAVVAALADYQKSLNPADPLAAAMPALEGGDAVRGEHLFRNHGTSQCIRCHKAGEGGHDLGGDAGPNLVGIAQRNPDRRYLLESLIVPGAAVAPGYGIVSLTLKSGKTIGGTLSEETAQQYVVKVGNEDISVKKSDVQSATAPISAMPPMGSLLTPSETRDIVAFLASLNQAPKNKPKRKNP